MRSRRRRVGVGARVGARRAGRAARRRRSRRPGSARARRSRAASRGPVAPLRPSGRRLGAGRGRRRAASPIASSSSDSSRPGACSGPRRRRWASASRAARRTWSRVDLVLAVERGQRGAARAQTMSARWPSTPSRAQVPAISSSDAVRQTDASALARRGDARRERRSSSAKRAANASGSRRRPAGGARSRRAPPGRAAGDLDGEPEAVEQLRAQVALLGVHRADQQEARGVGDGDAVALDVLAAQRGGVEQHVDQVVGQQVDLVDVEHAAVGRGEQAGLEARRRRRAARARGRACRARGRRSRRSAARRARPGGSDPGAVVRAFGARGAAPTGSQPKRHPARPRAAAAARAPRTAVVFAVPRSPRISTPPIAGSTAQASSASRSVVLADDAR